MKEKKHLKMKNNDSFIRWQNIRITQLGFANNLLIALGVALVGFTLEFIQADELILNCIQKILFWIGIVLSVVSMTLGVFVVINRLEDFKLTAQIARNRETENTSGINEDRAVTDKLGKKTWNCFIWQVVTFSIGFLMLLIMILIELIDIIV